MSSALHPTSPDVTIIDGKMDSPSVKGTRGNYVDSPSSQSSKMLELGASGLTQLSRLVACPCTQPASCHSCPSRSLLARQKSGDGPSLQGHPMLAGSDSKR